jgi:RimJ/RimL family protein N-acetyltransferase
MSFNLQPVHLRNERVALHPLLESDFELLYPLAADPLVWEQHPNPNRYRQADFETYFQGAMASKGAFLVVHAQTGEPLGCTRFLDYDASARVVQIGYTFFGRNYWGKGYNPATKRLMLDYAFQYVDRVEFYVGINNLRSRIAMERLGAVKTGTVEVAYYGEATKMNVIYTISRQT